MFQDSVPLTSVSDKIKESGNNYKNRQSVLTTSGCPQIKDKALMDTNCEIIEHDRKSVVCTINLLIDSNVMSESSLPEAPLRTNYV